MSTDSVPYMIDMALCVIKCLVLCCATLATWADQRDSLVQGVQKIVFLSYVLKSKQNLLAANRPNWGFLVPPKGIKERG